MTIEAKMTSEGSQNVPNDVDISNSLPVAIPLGHAIEPEPVIVIYNASAASAIFIAGPTAGTGISTSGTSYYAVTPRISSFAIASLVLGIISIVFIIFGMFLGLLAIVFGVLAVRRIKNRPNEYRGLCLAYSGIITGTIAMIFWISVYAAIAGSNDYSDRNH